MSTYRGVALPQIYDRMNITEQTWWKRGADAALAVAVPLVDSLHFAEECSLDHHGYCQTHSHLDLGPCPDGEAQKFLARAALPETVWRATIAESYLYWCKDHRPVIAVREVALADIHPAVTIQCTHCGKAVR